MIAERLDARRSQRLLPVLAAMGGAGAALGAVLVIPIASAVGASGVLVCAAAMLVLAAFGATRLPATRRVGAAPANVRVVIARSWRDGARAVRRHPLARHLAIVVAAAGVFGSLAYFALGVEVATRGGSTAEIAALLGGVRGGGQVMTLIVQLVIAPRILARGLVLHILGAAGRSAHRDTIASAARAEALATSPATLIAKVHEALHESSTDPVAEGETDMPSRVETLIALGRVPLLASLSTRQLADVAERARWSHPREGSIIVTSGDLIDAMIVVDDGELSLGERVIVKGEVVDELACFAPTQIAADLRAVRATRSIRLERVDFEELVDDVPGLAAAVCRGLGERAAGRGPELPISAGKSRLRPCTPSVNCPDERLLLTSGHASR